MWQPFSTLWKKLIVYPSGGRGVAFQFLAGLDSLQGFIDLLWLSKRLHLICFSVLSLQTRSREALFRSVFVPDESHASRQAYRWLKRLLRANPSLGLCSPDRYLPYL